MDSITFMLKLVSRPSYCLAKMVPYIYFESSRGSLRRLIYGHMGRATSDLTADNFSDAEYPHGHDNSAVGVQKWEYMNVYQDIFQWNSQNLYDAVVSKMAQPNTEGTGIPEPRYEAAIF